MTNDNRSGALARPQDRARTVMMQVRDTLKAKHTVLKALLPKEVTPERMQALVLTSFQRNPDLLKCDVGSILQCVYEAAKVGLEPDTVGQDCHLIPRKQRATFQLGFRGMMKLARRAGDVRQIWSGVVRDCDLFQWQEGADPRLEHVIDREAGDRDERKIVAAYACARFRDGFVQFRVVLPDEIKRAKATAAPSGPWKTHEPAMWEKTAIKRLCKLLPMPDAVQRVISLDDLGEAGQDQKLSEAWNALPDSDSNDEPAQVDVVPNDEVPADSWDETGPV